MDRPIRRLNWGCGPIFAKDWTNSDLVDYGQEHVGDIVHGLPYPDGWFDGAVAHHSLCALTAHDLNIALDELHRVIRVGCVLRITVPDILAAVRAYEARNREWAGFVAIREPFTIDEKFCRYVTWAGANRSVFTKERLRLLLDEHGFDAWMIEAPSTTVSISEVPLTDLDGRFDESLMLEGQKR